MNELAFANDEKLKYQQKIPHLNKKLEKAKNESNNLSDEVRKCKLLFKNILLFVLLMHINIKAYISYLAVDSKGLTSLFLLMKRSYYN